MKKKLIFPMVIMIYFSVFQDLFTPLVKGDIGKFLIQFSIVVFIIIFVLTVTNLYNKLNYDEPNQDSDSRK